jgi:ABC-type uncharacterized transport system permease subunit
MSAAVTGAAQGYTPPDLLNRRQRAVAYGQIMKAQIRSQMIYRSNFLFSLIGLLMQVYLLKVVWTAAFPDDGSATGADGRPITLAVQISYSTLAAVQYWLFNPWAMSTVPQRVRDGKVAVDLARPIRFTAQSSFAQAGVTLAGAPFVLIALPFAVLLGGAQTPASVGEGFLYVLSLLPAFLIALLSAAIIGMIAFWTLEIGGILMIYRMIAQFFAGALVPLWFMPGWLAGLANWLPFQATTYTPIAIYLGYYRDGGEIAQALAVQFGWVLVLWMLLRLVWSRALHRVVVQGG